MAMTHDYLDLLDEKIAISPANSEEEFQAAEVIAELMGRHDVEASVEEFSAPVVSGLVSPLLAAASLVGMVLVGVGVLPLTLIGFVLAVAPAPLWTCPPPCARPPGTEPERRRGAPRYGPPRDQGEPHDRDRGPL